MKHRSALGLVALLFISAAPVRAAETVTLTTLDWPPYTATRLPQAGISSAIVSKALAAEGVTVHYVFLPWNRAIDVARHGGADGFFPAYRRPSNPAWVFSNEIGVGPIFFVERRSQPVRWSSLDDLHGLLIGIDSGFVNTEEIDRRLADGRLHGDTALSDAQNLRKLASHRIDLAIIDSNVFNFLIAQPGLTYLAPQLRLERAPIENKELFVDFRSDARGRHFRDLLNQGLVKIGAATPAGIAMLQARLLQQ